MREPDSEPVSFSGDSDEAESGSRLFLGWRTGRDAASVAALRESGAVIVGKVVTTEFTATEPRGTRNPWDRKRTPGGSSSGSAANRSYEGGQSGR